MYSPQIDRKSAAIASALSQMEGIFHHEKVHSARPHFGVESNADLSVYAYFIQENSAVVAEQNLAAESLAFNEISRKRFFSILRRAAKAQEGVSRQERLFVQQFWSGMAEMQEQKI
ncbi:hypothetical protein [Dyadobacter sediminis]|uniref:TerB family tellurite resistance protein n=1 Tax=Dyadobacter sediminis TaxID=1493691 RepID=A0A5R9KC36_9BACT|nr:hypothetical protein [Dyadobacter sediminis]TLU92267.1 hypothetical protein FEM55_16155 [Dyadobacter sediminis]GGB95998.1 hypothetical protein GCM10011325_24150 [Dyadobacter sediminis]